ncbi:MULTISPECIES: hypothetical protein [Streptomyces]|uniref:LigA protein n=1 Tax=Streptomyces chartreusis NRRL 3882 TaxID=1079985 RepID=A0A2N9BH83_STRCX|nr:MULTISPECIES: hypothetical protein [Streptomyces]MYS89291.1 hypothetical protein [Streptomyces sp. SID5464]SOR82737.1 hypothetical protein SCNRRL3882_6186 [Streptomyces chartreusis NRRL 3882]
MTQSLARASVDGPAVRLSRPRRVLRAVAVLSCGPYLALKAAWIAGSHVGIPEGSGLLDDRVGMAVLNGISVLLDSAVIVLALVLTRPWGLRVPAWLPAFPVWVATGLLAPIMAGFPAQLVVRAFGGGSAPDQGHEPFLHAWVFTVVYTGFILQGLALGALFVLYARDRWGHLWRGRMWELPVSVVGPAHRALAVAAAVLALLPLALHVLWACGGTAGLSEGRAANRGGDFHVLEAVYAVFLLAAVAGGFLLAFRRGRALSAAVPLGLAWVGSGAAACWGGWLSLASLGGVEDIADRPTPLMSLAYAGQMLVGFLVAAIGVYSFAERSARAARRAP